MAQHSVRLSDASWKIIIKGLLVHQDNLPRERSGYKRIDGVIDVILIATGLELDDIQAEMENGVQMRTEEEIRAKLKEVQAHNTKNLNAGCPRMNIDFFNGGEWYLAWVLNELNKEE